MNKKKLGKLRGELAAARRSPQNARALEALAQSLGRRKAKRGKEPNWVNDNFPDLAPLSIPHHGGKDLPTGTKNNIVDQLSEDLFEWEDSLEAQDEDGEEDEAE